MSTRYHGDDEVWRIGARMEMRRARRLAKEADAAHAAGDHARAAELRRIAEHALRRAES